MTEMPKELFAVLSTGVPAILLTVDEDGFPHTAFTFAAASRPDCVAVVADDGSKTLANIERTRKASVQVLAEGNIVFLLKGTVRVSGSPLTASPVPSRRAVIELAYVKNQAWPEIAVAPIAYEYSERTRARWEGALPRLYAELRGESSGGNL